MRRLFPFLLLIPVIVAADDSQRILTIDHYVRVKSTVPAIAGETGADLRARTGAGWPRPARQLVYGSGRALRARRRHASRSRVRRAVSGLQLDGVPRARRLRRVLDGHDRLRPLDAAGADERSLQPRAEQIGRRRLSPRRARRAIRMQLTTIASDWNDIDAVVDYIRALRHVDRVSLVAWSLGGPRAGGYAAQHPEKVQKLVLLAPAYNRGAAAAAPLTLPADGRADEHAVARRVRRQLGSPGRLRGSVRPGRQRRRLVGDARVRSGRRHVGHRRAPRAADDHVGLERRRWWRRRRCRR